MSRKVNRRDALKAGLAASAGLAGGAFGFPFIRTRSRNRPKIIVILADTLRSHYLGCYGHTETIDGRRVSLTPNLDSLAERGILFKNCCAPSSWTPTSVAAIRTGRFPMVARPYHCFDYVGDDDLTMAEGLKKVGLRTMQLQTNHCLTRPIFRRGFDRDIAFANTDPKRKYVGADRVLKVLDKVIDRRAADYIWVHLMDNHSPYHSSPADVAALGESFTGGRKPFGDVEKLILKYPGMTAKAVEDGTVERMRRYYMASIRWLDRNLGAFLEGIERRLDGDALIIFTSDHGEEFGEHGALTHANNLYRETTDVPLIIYPTKGAFSGAVVENRVSSVDIAATVFEFLGQSPPAGDGASLWRRLAAAEDAEAFSCLDWWPAENLTGRKPIAHFAHTSKQGVRTLVTMGEDGHEAVKVYDLNCDPREKSDISATPVGAAAAERGLAAIEGRRRIVAARSVGSANAGEIVFTAEEQRQLRALGYLN